MNSKISLALCLIFCVIAGSYAEAQVDSSLRLTDLRCEYRVNPIGIDVMQPRLSWKLQSDIRGQKQTAYRILVADSQASLEENKGNFWDSGKIGSDQAIHVLYQGKPLRSRMRCYWKVCAWDKDGKQTPWSDVAFWSVGLTKPSDWSAKWLTSPKVTSLKPTERSPGLMLRKEFSADQEIKQATVYVTARGVYELRVNGQRVGDHILAPEWTDYHKRIQVQAFDVTKMLKQGTNAIGAILGEGWYSGRTGMAPPPGCKVYGVCPLFCMQLEVETADGQRNVIATDSTWQVTTEGPIRRSDILDGEIYDAQREIPGWDLPGFHEKAREQEQWHPVVTSPLDHVKLVWQRNEPIRVMHELPTVKLTEPKPGVYVFDVGQNMVGWCRLKLDGPKGTSVSLRYAERLNSDGTAYTANLRGAKQHDQYILRGEGNECFEPHFTYHGFRYVQVTGLSTPLKKTDLMGRVFYSASPKVGQFTCSNELLNQLMKNILWVQRGNMHGVPTDCPQRDERLGWMGDIQAFSQTAIFNMDMAGFFSKWIPDVRDAQTEDGRYPDYAPRPYSPSANPAQAFRNVPAWADAGIVVPWRMYQNYGDKRLLEEHYESAKRWIDFVHAKNPHLLWVHERGNDYGDWLNGDTVILDGYPRGISQIPKEIFATAFFAHSTEILSKMAQVLAREKDALKYKKLSEDIKAAFRRTYVTPAGRVQGDTQAGYALALHFGLLENSQRPKAVEYLLEAIKKYKEHPSTGIQSTHRMLMELSKNGHHDEASRLVNLRTVPSWGYTIDMGATTIWERWDGYVEGRGFQNPGMNSFNHYALGSVGEWIWREVIGINPDDSQPGFKHFIIRPRVKGSTCTWAKGSFDSIHGPIISDWRTKENQLTLKVTVPPNTTATVFVPSSKKTPVIENGILAEKSSGVRLIALERGNAVYHVESGQYEFVTSVD